MTDSTANRLPLENLASPTVVRRLLDRYGLRVRKSLGQHFLVDASILRAIVDAADLSPRSRVLEIGPGLGTLSRELALRSGMIAAIEYDRMLIPVLEETVMPLGNVRVVQGDAVRLLQDVPLPGLFESSAGSLPVSTIQTMGYGLSPEGAFQNTSITCVSNLPYGITSPLITVLLAQQRWLRSIVVMVQAEVADRLAASPGSESYGALTVFVSYQARVRRHFSVSRHSFYPPPDVDSAVVELIPQPGGTVPVRSSQRLLAVSRALFGQRRKKCANALLSLPEKPSRDAVMAALSRLGIDASSRGETLSLEEMAAIADALPGKEAGLTG